MVLRSSMAAAALLLQLLGLPVFLPRHASADGAAPTLRDHSIAVPILAELLKTDDGLASEVPCTGWDNCALEPCSWFQCMRGSAWRGMCV